jgi:hypothetical protein
MIYLRAGLYAEGPSDYHFLLPLLDRLIRETAARLFPGASEIEDTRAIDSTGAERQRASRIDAAIRQNEDLIDFLIIHADGGGDPRKARRERVDPGIAVARTAIPSKPVPALGCIPVRELEAWLLVDDRVFGEQLGVAVELPKAPDHEFDPKRLLGTLLAGRRRHPDNYYALFGEQVRFERLRRLDAFSEFEAELTELLRGFAHT